MLLAEIASVTGGLFYQSPGGLELHEIYNQIRADVSDDDIVMNEVLEGNDDDIAECCFWIEPNVHKLNVSCSWEEDGCVPNVRFFSPAGREAKQDDWGVSTNCTSSYCISTIYRPAAGQWHVLVEGSPSRVVVAVFVRSPLKVNIVPVFEYDENTFNATILTQLHHGDLSWTDKLNGSAVLRSVKQYSEQKRYTEKSMHHENLDAIPFPGLLEKYTFPVTTRSTQPVFSTLKLWNPSRRLARKADTVASSAGDTNQDSPGTFKRVTVVAFDGLNREVIYSTRMHIYGQFGAGFHYQRTAMRTISALKTLSDKSDKGWLVFGSVENRIGEPVSDVIVEAMDKDLFFHERLGSAIADQKGKFEIYYGAEEFTDLIFDQRPDIYLRVLARDGTILRISPIRYNAGHREEFRLVI